VARASGRPGGEGGEGVGIPSGQGQQAARTWGTNLGTVAARVTGIASLWWLPMARA
jgi:hypothetical protein